MHHWQAAFLNTYLFGKELRGTLLIITDSYTARAVVVNSGKIVIAVTFSLCRRVWTRKFPSSPLLAGKSAVKPHQSPPPDLFSYRLVVREVETIRGRSRSSMAGLSWKESIITRVIEVWGLGVLLGFTLRWHTGCWNYHICHISTEGFLLLFLLFYLGHSGCFWWLLLTAPPLSDLPHKMKFGVKYYLLHTAGPLQVLHCSLRSLRSHCSLHTHTHTLLPRQRTH